MAKLHHLLHYYPMCSISMPILLEYLLHFRLSGLAHSFIRVYLAALSAFLLPVNSHSVQGHP